MKKQYIIAIVIVLILAVVLFVFRQKKNDSRVTEHQKKTFEKMIASAQRSPKIGLPRMGFALNKFYEDKGKYPDTLMELYPEYISSQSFIEELEWYYEPKDDDFLLSRSVDIKNKTRVASIDKNIRPRTGTQIMLASVEKKVTEVLTERSVDGISSDVLIHYDTIKKRRGTGVKKKKEEKRASLYRPKVVFVEEGEIASGISSDIGKRFLVWKNEDGTLGFGDIKYPDARKLSIYSGGAWINEEKLMPEKKGTDFSEQFKTGSDYIAKNQSKQFVVWKDKNGHIGFGDNIYPDIDNLAVYAKGQWFNIEPTETVQQRSAIEVAAGAETTQETDPDFPAGKQSIKYVVWKDKNGHIGFGDSMYPDDEGLSVYSQGKWSHMETKPVKERRKPPQVSEEAETAMEKTPGWLAKKQSKKFIVWKDKNGNIGFSDGAFPDSEGLSLFSRGQWEHVETPPVDEKQIRMQAAVEPAQASDPDYIVKKQSKMFVVWKDKNGNMGFGDGTYPDADKLSVYTGDGQWFDIETPMAEKQKYPHVSPAIEPTEDKDIDTIAGDQSKKYLVWKDKNGNIGFGNVMYPEVKDISHINVNGNWEKVAN